MKNTFKKIAATVLALTCLIGTFRITAQAKTTSISSTSAYTTTISIETKGKLVDLLNAYPARITFTQTKGTYVYTDEYGKTKTTKDGYCLYDVKYSCYDEKGKFMFSGSDQIGGGKYTKELRAKVGKICTYKVSITPHYAYVWNKNTKSYYLGYKWTKPSKWTITAGKDINDLTLSRQSMNK